jgi:uncharacterized protein YndB with AHSA1/START domain
MARIRVVRTLDAPPEAVWAELAHVERHVTWMHDAVRIRFLTDQRSGVGTRYECDTRVGPFTTTDVMEITEWEPGRAMGVRHVGLVTGTGRFRLRRRRGGRTRFTWSEQLRFPLRRGGPVAALVAAPVLRWMWRRNLRALAARF